MDSESTAGRLSDEDRALIRRIGGQLSQLIHGMPAELPDIQRRDELGLLANMVSRVARELMSARAAGESHSAELRGRVIELQSAYETQEKLLGRVRDLSYPIMALHPEVLLVPVAARVPRAVTRGRRVTACCRRVRGTPVIIRVELVVST